MESYPFMVYIYIEGVCKDVHRTQCSALTIVWLTLSPYTTKIARIRCYTTKHYSTIKYNIQ